MHWWLIRVICYTLDPTVLRRSRHTRLSSGDGWWSHY